MELRLNWVVVFCLSISIAYSNAKAFENKINIIFEKQNIEVIYKKKKPMIVVEIAKTEQQHAQGLMFRDKLNKNEGMLFVFNDERILEFWMKNTLIDLDIGYFDKDKRLIDIKQMKAVTSIIQNNLPTYPSKQPAMFALEMTKGWFKKNKIEEGAIFRFVTNLDPVKNGNPK